MRISGVAGEMNWLLGGNYQKDDTSEQQDIVLNLPNSLPFFDHSIQDMDGSAKTWAIFVSVEYALAPPVNAQLSGRYTATTRRLAGSYPHGGTTKLTRKMVGEGKS